VIHLQATNTGMAGADTRKQDRPRTAEDANRRRTMVAGDQLHNFVPGRQGDGLSP
jgi:hypothetical protein